jgi:hypothetical protein
MKQLKFHPSPPRASLSARCSKERGWIRGAADLFVESQTVFWHPVFVFGGCRKICEFRLTHSRGSSRGASRRTGQLGEVRVFGLGSDLPDNSLIP